MSSGHYSNRNNDMPLSVTARWVLPLDAPPVEGGVVTVHPDRVTIEPPGTRPADDLGNVALLPAFVNAHTHLDLCGMAGLAPPSPDFTGWLKRVILHRLQRTPEQVRDDVRAGIDQCLRFGTAVVGDISGDGTSWPLLTTSPLRAVVFRELLGLAPERVAGSVEALDAWMADHPGTPHVHPGVSPHAPYSTHTDLYRAAARSGLPVCTHLAESSAEMELLTSRTGPFVTFLQSVGAWHPDGIALSPRHVVELLATPAPVLLAHANHLPDDVPLSANVTVVYCPRTHAAFGHPPHPVTDLIARGVRVALGTDSLASSPDLDVLEEVRHLHRLRPNVPPRALLQLATSPEPLGLPRGADLVAIPVPSRATDDPHRLLIEEGHGPRRLMIAGRWLT